MPSSPPPREGIPLITIIYGSRVLAVHQLLHLFEPVTVAYLERCHPAVHPPKLLALTVSCSVSIQTVYESDENSSFGNEVGLTVDSSLVVAAEVGLLAVQHKFRRLPQLRLLAAQVLGSSGDAASGLAWSAPFVIYNCSAEGLAVEKVATEASVAGGPGQVGTGRTSVCRLQVDAAVAACVQPRASARAIRGCNTVCAAASLGPVLGWVGLVGRTFGRPASIPQHGACLKQGWVGPAHSIKAAWPAHVRCAVGGAFLALERGAALCPCDCCRRKCWRRLWRKRW